MKDHFTENNPKDRINGRSQEIHEKKLEKRKKYTFFKKPFSREAILMTVSMVVQRKDDKNRNMKDFSFSMEDWFYNKVLKIASIVLHKEDMRKQTRKLNEIISIRNCFYLKLS